MLSLFTSVMSVQMVFLVFAIEKLPATIITHVLPILGNMQLFDMILHIVLVLELVLAHQAGPVTGIIWILRHKVLDFCAVLNIFGFLFCK